MTRRSVLFIFCLFVGFNIVYCCKISQDCPEFQYCSPYDQQCQSCANICEKSHHNYDENRCTRDCQAYLQNLDKAEIQNLRLLVSLSLALNCIIIIFLIIVTTINVLKWKKKRGVSLTWLRNKLKKKEKPVSDRQTTVSVTTSSGRPDLRLDMPPIGVQTPTPNGNTPSTATTTLSRRPTEDNALDYAYDNPAMSNTPSPQGKPHESSL